MHTLSSWHPCWLPPWNAPLLGSRAASTLSWFFPPSSTAISKCLLYWFFSSTRYQSAPGLVLNSGLSSSTVLLLSGPWLPSKFQRHISNCWMKSPLRYFLGFSNSTNYWFSQAPYTPKYNLTWLLTGYISTFFFSTTHHQVFPVLLTKSLSSLFTFLHLTTTTFVKAMNIFNVKYSSTFLTGFPTFTLPKIYFSHIRSS